MELPPLVELLRLVQLRGVVLDEDSVPLLVVLALLVVVWIDWDLVCLWHRML